MPSSQWDHSADKDLLLAIIEGGNLKGILWPTIAAKMQAKNYSFSHEACRQHFQKIRKESNKAAGIVKPAAASPSSAAGQATTPRKRSKATKTMYNENEDDDDEEELTPAKRKKSVKKEERDEDQENDGQRRSAYQVKVEYLGGDGVINLDDDDLYEVA